MVAPLRVAPAAVRRGRDIVCEEVEGVAVAAAALEVVRRGRGGAREEVKVALGGQSNTREEVEAVRGGWGGTHE
ncbi:hypothetical protein E2562_008739 [Oryza meyeriana var. granulata]|uniref:Uncharacterized protein n=1 Tax=Oryza meyeriana var. granulata TaxID=110450 RepID=A0A6G1F5Y9_9ORYZ|nr:hypothetical protein E2562_008739 [Oryza meyeriana var. granulata]